MSNPHRQSHVDDDDDLDDLDDVANQFKPRTSSEARPAPTNTTAPPNPSEDDFLAQLAQEMEQLLRGQRTDPRADSDVPDEGDFQANVRAAMDRLKKSELDLKSPDADASGGDTFESLQSQLEGLGDGAESEEDLQGVLDALMSQLMGKDVLYEPLKELYDKFPEYLTRDTISAEDRGRYGSQIVCIKQLLDEFEAGGYRDEDEKSREKIVALMTELQSYGSPPEEIMGPLPPGVSMGADGLPNVPDGCNMN